MGICNFCVINVIDVKYSVHFKNSDPGGEISGSIKSTNLGTLIEQY